MLCRLQLWTFQVYPPLRDRRLNLDGLMPKIPAGWDEHTSNSSTSSRGLEGFTMLLLRKAANASWLARSTRIAGKYTGKPFQN